MEFAETGTNNSAVNNSADKKIKYCSLFWIFLVGSVAGYVIEGLWDILKTGSWGNHSATVIGPFCIIYGFGAMAVYTVSVFTKEKSLPLQFVLFSGAGDIVEYIGSLLQEVIFGSVSWDYSQYPLNFAGRISLRHTLMWGLLGIIFARLVFPILVRFLDEMKSPVWNVSSIVLSVFMAANMLLSAAAVLRWRDRLSGSEAGNAVEEFLDDTYGNDTMKDIYKNMIFSIPAHNK